jgi:hypothetical protein
VTELYGVLAADAAYQRLGWRIADMLHKDHKVKGHDLN